MTARPAPRDEKREIIDESYQAPLYLSGTSVEGEVFQELLIGGNPPPGTALVDHYGIREALGEFFKRVTADEKPGDKINVDNFSAYVLERPTLAKTYGMTLTADRKQNLIVMCTPDGAGNLFLKELSNNGEGLSRSEFISVMTPKVFDHLQAKYGADKNKDKAITYSELGIDFKTAHKLLANALDQKKLIPDDMRPVISEDFLSQHDADKNNKFNVPELAAALKSMVATPDKHLAPVEPGRLSKNDGQSPLAAPLKRD